VIISHLHKFIFVKTRKTAGTSVELTLSRVCGDRDVITPTTPEDEAIRRAKGGIGPQNTEISGHDTQSEQPPHFYNHFPAAGVRRAVGSTCWSEYRTFTVERNPWSKAVSLYYWRTKDLPRRPAFSEFLRATDVALLSNYDLYADDSGVLVQRVLRYEALAEQLAEWWRVMELPGQPDLPRAKGGYRPAGDWRALYADGDVDFVAEVCAREIATFGYRFAD
jgi:hypothetical protein